MKYILYAILLLPALVVAQPLNGSYSIGPNSADYPDLDSAVTDLETVGIDGPVVFNLQSGYYNQNTIFIPSITGSSAINTITFQSETLDPDDVEIENSGIFTLLQSSHIRFKYLTLDSNDGGISYNAISINGGSDIEISNCKFHGGRGNITYSFYMDSSNRPSNSYVNISQSDDILIKDNQFGGGGAAVHSNAQAGNVCLNIQILDNIVTSGLIPFDLVRAEGINIERNEIIGNIRYHAMRMALVGGDCIVNRNKIFTTNSDLPEGFTSMSLISNPNGTSSLQVSNNFINLKTSFSFLRFDDVKILNNSIHSRERYALYTSNGDDISSLSIYNNIMSTEGSFNILVSSTFDLAILSADKNVFDSAYDAAAIINGNNYSYYDLSEWQTLTGEDQNSFVSEELFVSESDFHTPNAVLLDGTGIPFPEVTEDIDGETRSSINPDIGADEFVVDPSTINDLEITAIVSPLNVQCEDNPVVLAIRNNGTSVVNTFDIECSVNEFRGNVSSYSTVINQGQTVEVTLNSCEIVKNNHYAKMDFYVSNPNGTNDNNYSNNLAQITDLMQLGDYNIDVDAESCSGSYVLSVPQIYNTTVLWSTGETTPEITVTSAGTYSVTITDGQGCPLMKMITIN